MPPILANVDAFAAARLRNDLYYAVFSTNTVSMTRHLSGIISGLQPGRGLTWQHCDALSKSV